MAQESGPRIAAEVLTATVWDAVKDVAGVVELRRSPLQSLGERVHLERRGPVRLQYEAQPPVLEVHLVVAAGRPIPPVAEEVRRALAPRLTLMEGMTGVIIHVMVDDLAAPAAGP